MKETSQVKDLTPINEIGTTTPVSSEEYISSHEDELSLDDIFDIMARAKTSTLSNTEIVNETGRSKFEELKESVENLPTIKSNSLKEQDNHKNKVQKINDPITSILLKNPNKSKSKDDKTQLKKQKSDKWFELPKPELTNPLKQQLTILQNRQYIDPKRFYKKQKWEIPERFQIGEIMSSSVTDGSSRAKLNRKQKGGDMGLLGELMNDDTSKKWFKRKYSEIQEKKLSGGKKYYKDKMARRLKR